MHKRAAVSFFGLVALCVGLARTVLSAPNMTVCMVIFLLKNTVRTPYVCMVLAIPSYVA